MDTVAVAFAMSPVRGGDADTGCAVKLMVEKLVNTINVRTKNIIFLFIYNITKGSTT